MCQEAICAGHATDPSWSEGSWKGWAASAASAVATQWRRRFTLAFRGGDPAPGPGNAGEVRAQCGRGPVSVDGRNCVIGCCQGDPRRGEPGVGERERQRELAIDDGAWHRAPRTGKATGDAQDATGCIEKCQAAPDTGRYACRIQREGLWLRYGRVGRNRHTRRPSITEREGQQGSGRTERTGRSPFVLTTGPVACP
jgi:hypothetical protein